MSLQDVFIEELRDLYSAENQLLKAMPKMAKATKTAELRAAFTSHVEESKEQVERLKQAFQILGKKPTGQHCNGWKAWSKRRRTRSSPTRKGRPRMSN